MEFLFCFLAFFSHVYAEVSWKHKADLSNSKDYLPRTVSLTSEDIGNYLPFEYSSTQINHTDLVIGAVWAGGDSYTPPVSSIAYFHDATQWNVTNTNTIYGDYTDAMSYVALSYVKLEEVDAAGNVVKTISLDAGSLPWHASNVTQTDAFLTYATLTGGYTKDGTALPWENSAHASVTNFDHLSISLTSIIANESVVLSNGVILTSKSIEILMEIIHFPYFLTEDDTTADETSLRLHFVMAFAGPTPYINQTQFKWGDRFTSGKGMNATHIDFANHAICGNVTCPVLIEYGPANESDLYNYKLVNKVLHPLAAAGHNIVLQKVQVTFPPMEGNITWDPTIGTGTGPVPRESSGLSSGAELGIILGAVVGASLIATALTILWIRSRKRAQKAKDTKDTQEDTNLVKPESQHSYQALA